MRALFSEDVARLVEPRMAADLCAAADEHEAILGGVMARSGPGSWTNHAIGLCLDGRADDSSLDRLTAYYESRGIEPRVEVCPLADPSLVEGLGARGFVFHGFEFVFARALGPGESVEARVAHPEGLALERVDPADEGALRRYGEGVYRTFFPEGHPGPTENDLETMTRYLRKEGTIAVAAMVDGVFAGGGAVSAIGELALLAGAGVRERYRRRGIQLHLLAERLRLASRAGARVVAVCSKPGSGTERNVVRMGFAMSYARAILVRRGEGLVGEPG